MAERKPFSFSFRKDELLAHYFGMTPEERHSDFDAGLECIRKDAPEGDSFGAEIYRKAEASMSESSELHRQNAEARWSKNSKRADAGEGDLPVRDSDAPTARTSARSLSAGDAANPPSSAELVTAVSSPAKRAKGASAGRFGFEAFRKAYPGTKRGADVEWDNFIRKNPPSAVALLMPALEREKAYKAECARVGAFCPEWAHMSTWINQRRWTQEFSEPTRPAVRKTSEDLENEKKSRMVKWLNDRAAGVPTGETYEDITEADTEDTEEALHD